MKKKNFILLIVASFFLSGVCFAGGINSVNQNNTANQNSIIWGEKEVKNPTSESQENLMSSYEEEKNYINSRLNEYVQEYNEKLDQDPEYQRQKEFLENTRNQRMYMDEFIYMKNYPSHYDNYIWW